jgi:hypothetical protein
MSKDDKLDPHRAAAFAWRFTRPGEENDLPDDVPSEAQETVAGESHGGESTAGQEDAVPPGASPTRDASKARDGCAALIAELEAIRRMPEAGQTGVSGSSASIASLLRWAGELGHELCAVEGHPWQSARLHRLARHGRYLLDADREDAWESPRRWYSDVRLLELWLEVTRAGALASLAGLMVAISDGRWPAVARLPAAIARVARTINDGPSQIARGVAVDACRKMGQRATVHALRRALRTPHFSLRYRALDELEQRFPDQIQAADVVFLLEDAVIHAPPDSNGGSWGRRAEASIYLPRMLASAIARLRPEGAVEPLVRLVEGRCVHRWSLSPSLGEEWALDVLATVFPDVAAPLIDRRLGHVELEQRELAAAAAGRLPDALARPRLLVAAADGVPEMAERAQAIWRERYDTPCPFDPMSGVQTALLAGPPSERMRARLSVLRSAPLEARAELTEVLLGEAPDPEALVLLLFAAVDNRIWERRIRPGVPEYRQTFCRALIERFGTRAVAGLLALEARYPDGEAGWLGTLAELVMDGHIPEAAYPAVRAAVARHCAIPDVRPGYPVLTILAHVGASPDLPELSARLWRMACDPAQSEYCRAAAVRALARLPAEGGDLDVVVQAEMEAALAVSDLPRFARAAAVGLGLELPVAIALTERVLDERGPARPDDPRVTAALAACVEALATAGRLSDTFLAEALARSGTYLCAAAARHARDHSFLGPDADALAALLAGDDPICAAEAACTLLAHGLIDSTYPRLFAIAARVPAVLRAELLSLLRFRGASWSSLWPLLEPLLVSGDPEVTAPLVHLAHEFDRDGLPEKLLALLPRVLDRELRTAIVDIFACEGRWYWKDHADD